MGPRAESSWRRHSLARPQHALIGLSSPMASLEDLALDLASSYAHRRETLAYASRTRRSAAEEKARRRWLFALAFGVPPQQSAKSSQPTLAHRIEARIGIVTRSRAAGLAMAPARPFDGDDDHELCVDRSWRRHRIKSGPMRRQAADGAARGHLRARSATAGGRRRRRSLSTTASSPPPSSSRLKPMATARPLRRHHRAPSRLLLLLLLRRRHRP